MDEDRRTKPITWDLIKLISASIIVAICFGILRDDILVLLPITLVLGLTIFALTGIILVQIISVRIVQSAGSVLCVSAISYWLLGDVRIESPYLNIANAMPLAVISMVLINVVAVVSLEYLWLRPSLVIVPIIRGKLGKIDIPKNPLHRPNPEELRKWGQLLDSGHISQEEFNRQKARILGDDR